ncbi:MAG: hypothetical protein ACI9OJ_002512 [Myxococcota bacterium]|jgi:hypothetical protein
MIVSRSVRLGGLIMVGLLAASPCALGDSPERRANAKYNEARALISAGALGAAVEKLGEAWGIFEHPLIMKKRAEVQEQRAEYVLALADYRTFESRLSKRKKKARAEAAATIAKLEAIIAAPVTVSVTSGATTGVSVGDRAAKKTPFDIELPRGEHTLTIDDSKFVPASTTIQVKAGTPQVVTLEPVGRTGRVILSTDREHFDETDVSIDGIRQAIAGADRSGATLSPIRLGIGQHMLRCQLEDTPVFTTAFTVPDGADVTVLCNFESVDPSVAGDTWGWVVAGSGIAATLAGVGLLGSYAADVSLAEERNQDLVTEKHIIGGVLLGVGVGLAVGSYFVFTRDQGGDGAEPSDASHWWQPNVVPNVVPLQGGALFGTGGRF